MDCHLGDVRINDISSKDIKQWIISSEVKTLIWVLNKRESRGLLIPGCGRIVWTLATEANADVYWILT